eukprot:COSAG04_NODE_1045_length_8578_cov_9.398396_7_plen_95_part_00
MIPVRVNPAAPQPKAKRAQPPLRLRMPSAVPPLQTLSAQRHALADREGRAQQWTVGSVSRDILAWTILASDMVVQPSGTIATGGRSRLSDAIAA